MKKYKVIVKVSNNQFCKWRCDDLLSLVRFLDKSYPDWRWFNVFDNIESSAKYREQVANFTRTKRPVSKVI